MNEHASSNTRAAMTVPEVADTLRLSQATVRRRIADGELRAIRLGGAVRIPATELERLLAPTPPAEAA